MKSLVDSGSIPANTGRTAQWPFVSVVIPVYNEEHFIARCLDGVLQQDYPSDRIEIIVADGGSDDRTRDVVAGMQQNHPHIRLIDNPRRIVPTGLNRAIAWARGDVIVRLDGHCEYPRNYIQTVVHLRQKTGADNVGGVLVPVGTTYVQRAVAAAYYSPVGLGGAALKATAGKDEVREVDAVHGGCWKRERLLSVGGFDEAMVRNQDDELSFRLRKQNGRILQCLSLRVVYHVRNSLRKLFRQFFQYGYWKVQVIRRHPRQASLRHIAPAGFVLLLGNMALAALFVPVAAIAFAGLLATYLGTMTLVSILQLKREIKLLPALVAALVCMHTGYGTGFLAGCAQSLFLWSNGSRLFAGSTR